MRLIQSWGARDEEGSGLGKDAREIKGRARHWHRKDKEGIDMMPIKI